MIIIEGQGGKCWWWLAVDYRDHFYIIDSTTTGKYHFRAKTRQFHAFVVGKSECMGMCLVCVRDCAYAVCVLTRDINGGEESFFVAADVPRGWENGRRGDIKGCNEKSYTPRAPPTKSQALSFLTPISVVNIL